MVNTEVLSQRFCLCVRSIPRGQTAHAPKLPIGLKFHSGRGHNVTYDKHDSSPQLISVAAFVSPVTLIVHVFKPLNYRHRCENIDATTIVSYFLFKGAHIITVEDRFQPRLSESMLITSMRLFFVSIGVTIRPWPKQTRLMTATLAYLTRLFYQGTLKHWII